MAPVSPKLSFTDAASLMAALGSLITTARGKSVTAHVGIESHGFVDHGVASLIRLRGDGHARYLIVLADADEVAS